MKKGSIRKVQHISYTYEVTDAYGHTSSFDNKKEAENYAKYVALQKTIIQMYIKPRGVTLVLCKNPNVFYKIYPCFIGWNGVPFCKVLADKERNHYMNLNNTIERISHLNGDLCEIIQKAYGLLSVSGNETFNCWDGACHYSWNHITGNDFCFYAAKYWLKDVLWYNWDGKHFSTNDSTCTLTDLSFSI